MRVALERAGACCIVLEGIPREVAAMITRELEIPTIGIGAGPECDGQVLVFHDVLGLTFAPRGKIRSPLCRCGQRHQQRRARIQRRREVGRRIPSEAESYHLPKETQRRCSDIAERKRACAMM